MVSQIEELQNKNNESIVYKDDEYYVERSTQLTPLDTEKLWEIIQSGFAAVNAKTEHKQDMEYDEFKADIDNQNVIKYLAKNETGEIVGYLSVHVGLDEVNWIPRDIIGQVQKEADDSATPYYISTFVVPPSMQGLNLGAALLKGSLTDMASVSRVTGKNGIAFFDCAEVNYPMIPQYTRRVAQDLTTENETYAVKKIYEECIDDSTREKQYYYSVTISLH